MEMRGEGGGVRVCTFVGMILEKNKDGRVGREGSFEVIRFLGRVGFRSWVFFY